MIASKSVILGIVLGGLAGCAGTPPSYDDAMRDYQTGQRGLAVQKLSWLADHGDPQAATQLGVMYMYGDSLPQSYDRAEPLLLEGAQGGVALAQVNLGYLYENGLAVKQDYQQAFAWYHKAADQGETVAENDLGNLYKTGHGVQQDYTQALVWLRKSADTGNNVACANMAEMYFGGLGVPKDANQGADWMMKAAQGGNFRATVFLASVYEHGYYGIPKDEAKAALLFKQASNHLSKSYASLQDAMRLILDAHKTYPQEAIQAHVEGAVKVEFDCPYQTVTNARITQSSGNASLDAAALDAVDRSIFPRRAAETAALTHFMSVLNFSLHADGSPVTGYPE